LFSLDYLIACSSEFFAVFCQLVAGFTQQVSKNTYFFLVFGIIMVSYGLVAVFIK